MSDIPTLGIDFGGTSIKIAAVKGADLISDMERIPTQQHEGPDALIEEIKKRVDSLRAKFPDIAAVGIGVPGAIDFEKGITYNLTNVRGWTNIRLRDIIQEKIGLPTVLENDANCMAYAEFKHGAGKGFRNVVCVTLGTGVGGGLILNGELFRGSRFAAGEIGQMSVDLYGVDGPYGNRGALERYIGNRQIGELAAQKYFDAGKDAPEDLSPENLSNLAEAGDEVAVAVWDTVATYLGACLMSTIYLLNPDAIVIGGGVAHAGDVLFIPLREKLKNSLTRECFDDLTLSHARFGNTAGIIGCSTMARELLDA
ncbi:MAG: ROK family protein [Verrucomicrobiales bacterium]|nr:ROK family protein [Verrucomicrobiales bacterium]